MEDKEHSLNKARLSIKQDSYLLLHNDTAIAEYNWMREKIENGVAVKFF